MKLNLDWKVLLLGHGEKAVLGIVSVVVVLLVWRAIGRGGMEPGQEPEDIQRRIATADSNIGQTLWKDFPDRPELKDPGRRSVMDPVNLNAYQVANRLNIDIWKRKVLRGDPPLLTVAELETHASYGPFSVAAAGAADEEFQIDEQQRDLRRRGAGGPRPALNPEGIPGGALIEGAPAAGGAGPLNRPIPAWFGGGAEHQTRGGKAEGRRWIVVKGLVPIAAQQAEFDAAFQQAEAYDSQRDVVKYFGCVVEKADVTGGQAPNWQPINVKSSVFKAALDKWGVSGKPDDVVEAKYVHEHLTFPLGPLLMGQWDASVTHSKIPLAPTPEELALKARQEAQAAPQEVKPTKPGGEFGDDEETPTGEGIPYGRGTGRAGEVAGPPRRAVPEAEMGSDIVGLPADMLLFRYFDFDVVPGHSYVYRVRLVVRDPNYSDPSNPAKAIPERHLKKEVIDRLAANRTPYLMTDPSEPTSPTSVPYDHDVFAGEVKAAPPDRFNVEPTANVLVQEFDVATGRTKQAERPMARGACANFKQTVWVVDWAAYQQEKVTDLPFTTETLLVDLDGGDKVVTGIDGTGKERLSSSLTAPGQLLFQDQTGKVFVRSELDDWYVVDEYRKLQVEEAAPSEQPYPTGAGRETEAGPPGLGPPEEDYPGPPRKRRPANKRGEERGE